MPPSSSGTLLVIGCSSTKSLDAGKARSISCCPSSAWRRAGPAGADSARRLAGGAAARTVRTSEHSA
eukprot:5456062-Prymnesium_polylepis.1